MTNARARQAYAKVGFRDDGLLLAHELHEGVPRDCLRMLWTPPEPT